MPLSEAFVSVRFKLHEISSAPVISISGGDSSCSVRSPVWVLNGLLRFRIFSSFEPLSSSPFRILKKMMLIFRYLGCSHEGRGLQVVSRYVSFASPGTCVASVPNFLTKTESSSYSLPHCFLVKFFFGFHCGPGPGWLRCLVSALRVFIRRMPWWHLSSSFMFILFVLMFFDVPHSFLQACAVAVDENHSWF